MGGSNFLKKTIYNLTQYNHSFLVNEPQKSIFTVLVKGTSLNDPIVGKSPSYYVFHLCSFPIILLTTNIFEAEFFFCFMKEAFLKKDFKIREKLFHSPRILKPVTYL